MSGLKEEELIKHVTCVLCRKPIAHSGVPIFYTLQLKQYALDTYAIKQRDALTQFIGSSVVANAISPSVELALEMNDSKPKAICLRCTQTKEFMPIMCGLMEG